MRSENMSKSHLITYDVTKVLSPLIVVAKDNGDSNFYTGSRINDISEHAH